MRMTALSLAAAVLMAAPASALPCEIAEPVHGQPRAEVRAGLPAGLEMACQPLDTDFDDPHAHGDQLCVLVLEQSGRYQLVGQWIQRESPRGVTPWNDAPGLARVE